MVIMNCSSKAIGGSDGFTRETGIHISRVMTGNYVLKEDSDNYKRPPFSVASDTRYDKEYDLNIAYSKGICVTAPYVTGDNYNTSAKPNYAIRPVEFNDSKIVYLDDNLTSQLSSDTNLLRIATEVGADTTHPLTLTIQPTFQFNNSSAQAYEWGYGIIYQVKAWIDDNGALKISRNYDLYCIGTAGLTAKARIIVIDIS